MPANKKMEDCRSIKQDETGQRCCDPTLANFADVLPP